MEQNNEKILTKYDRKRLAKEEAAKREKRRTTLSIAAVAAVILCIAALLIIVPLQKSRKLLREYFRINEESVSELEFNFHRTNLINSNASYLQYFGMTSVADLDTMVYDKEKGTTWGDFFTERAAESIKENRALIADAKAKNVSLDVDTEYKAYLQQLKTEAANSDMSTDSYLTALYGASEKKLRRIIKDNLTAALYSEHLSETNAATDEEAQAKYDANPKDYDSVDYRVLSFTPELPEDASEEERKAIQEETKAKAQEMLDKVKAGEDFETLCVTYAPEDKRTDYADSETDLSLVTDETYTYTSSLYGEWLFDSARAAGDATLYTDENSGVHFVLLFEKRYMGEKVLENIKQSLTNDTVMEYISSISKDYVISDPEDHLPTL